jgi:hypothetical protein
MQGDVFRGRALGDALAAQYDVANLLVAEETLASS